MSRCRRLAAGLSLVFAAAAAVAVAGTDINQLPKYGGGPKNAAQVEADRRLLEGVDAQFGGDRPRAAREAAQRGWDEFRRGRHDDAMRRFNQAWLIDPTNGAALWGMAAVSGVRGQRSASLALFAEAEPSMRGDIDFEVDHALSLGRGAVDSQDRARIDAALARFERLHAKAPQHVLNLQNWAVTLAALGRYDEAWAKVQLAQSQPRRDALDPRFVAELQAKRSGVQAVKVSAPAPAAAAPRGVAPELWSGHKALKMTVAACGDQAFETLNTLEVWNVVRNGDYSYGVFEGNRATVKCVATGNTSFVYYAVAGDDRTAVSALRDRIAARW